MFWCFCSLSYQPDTLNLCRIWMTLSQDIQTQPFPPQCLNSVQSQADDSNSIKRKSYSRSTKTTLIINSYVIFRALLHLKNGRCCLHFWQWHNITPLQFSKQYTLPALVWYFPFRLARSIFLLFVHEGGKIPDWSSTVYPLYLPHRTHTTIITTDNKQR